MENPVKFIGYVRREDIKFDVKMCETRKLPQTVYESKKTEAMSSRIVKWLAEKEKTIVYFPYAQNAFDASRGVRGFAGIKTDPRIGVFTGKNVDELSTETFNEKKRETFEKFRTGEQPIMYATKAFGMGVDIDDVANIYPIKEDLSEVPFAELKVYEALEKLGKNFYIFHSVQWLKKTKKWAATWKENDFLIINRNLGALVLEIKGGDIEYTGTVFHQINTQTEEVSVLDPKKKKDPLSQAIDGAYHYRRVFEKITKATETRMALDDRFPVEVAVWFPGCKIGEKMKKFPLAYREAEQAVLDLSSFDKNSVEGIR